MKFFLILLASSVEAAVTKYHRLGLSRHDFATVLIAGTPLRYQHGQVLVRGLCLACIHFLAMSSNGRERVASLLLSLGHRYHQEGPTLMTSSDYHLKAPLPNFITLGVRAAKHESGRIIIQSQHICSYNQYNTYSSI